MQIRSEPSRHLQRSYGIISESETEKEITNTKATREQEEVDYAIFTVELTEEVESSIITAEQSSQAEHEAKKFIEEAEKEPE